MIFVFVFTEYIACERASNSLPCLNIVLHRASSPYRYMTCGAAVMKIADLVTTYSFPFYLEYDGDYSKGATFLSHFEKYCVHIVVLVHGYQVAS